MKAAQRQFLVSVQGISGYFATLSGEETEAETTKVWDGGSQRPEVLTAPPEDGNLTLTRPYDPERDQPVIDRLRPLVGRWRTTLTKQPTDPDLVPIGKPTTFPDAVLVRLAAPEVDAGSSDPATFELEFAVSGTA
ncbi:hypothetical protein LI90_4371 (plasmid) [Carbonactinospora thermoautotrophica]|uniref:Uncharacterized protein n=1 Tax=Carbonactinospora thermoautotrophica TaxID=1469144 RepID=A0A132MI00_9ACTN|nr:hypothetical protein [Carbonactinospora thermoautotrophica]KWW97399.1 hypothetical protein LI90_4371 [Carbonactinospora thermoautotrophica]